MYPIQGTWNGEYSMNHGTSDDPDVRYFHFELHVEGDKDEFSGRFIDQTLRTDGSSIQGFIEDSFISFVRHTPSSSELLNALRFDLENMEKPLELNFSGNYNTNENCYEGIWDVTIDEDYNGLQDDVISEIRTGAWYMRKL